MIAGKDLIYICGWHVLKTKTKTKTLMQFDRDSKSSTSESNLPSILSPLLSDEAGCFYRRYRFYHKHIIVSSNLLVKYNNLVPFFCKQTTSERAFMYVCRHLGRHLNLA